MMTPSPPNSAPSPPSFVAYRGGAAKGLTVDLMPRRLKLFQVTEDELESLYTSGNYKTLDIGLFSLCFGVVVTVAGTLATVDISSDRTHAVFWAVLVVSLFAAVFFAFRSVIAWRSAARRLADIRESGSMQP